MGTRLHATDPAKAASIAEMSAYNIYHDFIGFSMTSITYILALTDALLPQKLCQTYTTGDYNASESETIIVGVLE